MGVICFVCGARFGGLVGTVTLCVWCRLGKKIKKTRTKAGQSGVRC